MKFTSLKAISPVDGRYRDKTNILENYFSEYALIKYRVLVEVEYFIALINLQLEPISGIDKTKIHDLRKIYLNFKIKDAEEVKSIEKQTNHDVKAVEYFLKTRLEELGLGNYKEFIHFGLTSQDINNTATPLSVKDAFNDVLRPFIEEVQEKLKVLSKEWKDIPMLARTHGQPASPTLLGKEIFVFLERLNDQMELLDNIPFSAKFGGATGNFNAHHVAFPEINWIDFANDFVNNVLGLKRQKTTTQIEHYDDFAAFCDALKRINTIMTDLDRDMWHYISLDYFKQKLKKGEVGSSTMPHKVNPIDFENSEGNFGIASAIFEHLAAKLPISRLQRDLTDSTVTRNIGVPIAHTIIGIKSLLKGLDKLLLNKERIDQDLEDNWAVMAEAVQTILRRENYPNPYEALKDLTRVQGIITRDTLHTFIQSLDIEEKVKIELLSITPQNYTGISEF